MIHSLLTSLPMTVCLFWTVTLMCDIVLSRLHTEPATAARGWLRPRYYLLLFLAVTSVLYLGHCVYFNRLTHLMVATDSLYVAANLAVYPLYYLYICALTQREDGRRLRFALLLPALAAGVTVALLYAGMTDGETRLSSSNISIMAGIRRWDLRPRARCMSTMRARCCLPCWSPWCL